MEALLTAGFFEVETALVVDEARTAALAWTGSPTAVNAADKQISLAAAENRVGITGKPL
jgi:hypothetical protein